MQGWIESALYDRIVVLLERARLPIKPPASMTVEQFRALMAVDKKVRCAAQWAPWRRKAGVKRDWAQPGPCRVAVCVGQHVDLIASCCEAKASLCCLRQVLAGKLRLILLRGSLGNCVVTGDFDPAKLEETLSAFCSAATA